MGLNQAVHEVRKVAARIIQSLKEMKWRILLIAIAGLGFVLIMFLLSSLSLFDNFEHTTLDWRFKWTRSNANIKSNFTIILVGRKIRENRERGEYAKIVDACEGWHGYHKIGFDLVLHDNEWFIINSKYEAELDRGEFSAHLREAFKENDFDLLPCVTVKKQGQEWVVTDEWADLVFTVRKDGDVLYIEKNTIEDQKKPSFQDKPVDDKSIYYTFARIAGDEPKPLYTKDEYKYLSAILKGKSRWTDIPNLKDKLSVKLDPEYLIAPAPKFIKMAKGIGHSHTTAEKAKAMRKAPLLIKYDDHIYPHLSLQIACDYLGVEINDDNIDAELGRHIKLKKDKKVIRTVPIDDEGYMYINYAGEFKDAFKGFIFEIEDVTESERPPRINKLVLIGAKMEEDVGIRTEETVEKRKEKWDCHYTTFGDYPGVGIVATVLDNILQEDFLYPKGNLNIVTLSALGLMVGVIGTSRSPFRSIWLILTLAIYLFSAFLFFLGGRWIEAAAPLIILPTIILGYIAYDIHRPEFARTKQPLITWGVGAVILAIGVFVFIMIFQAPEGNKLAYISTLLTVIALIFSTNIFGSRRSEGKSNENKDANQE